MDAPISDCHNIQSNHHCMVFSNMSLILDETFCDLYVPADILMVANVEKLRLLLQYRGWRVQMRSEYKLRFGLLSKVFSSRLRDLRWIF